MSQATKTATGRAASVAHRAEPAERWQLVYCLPIPDAQAVAIIERYARNLRMDPGEIVASILRTFDRMAGAEMDRLAVSSAMPGKEVAL